MYSWYNVARSLVRSTMQCIAVVVLLILAINSKKSSGMTTSVTDAKHEGPITVHVLAVVPTVWEEDNIKALPKWKRGEEILPGALLAIKEISDSINLLSGYQLEVIPIRVPLCDFNTGIVSFVKEFTSNENNIAGIVGYFCHNVAQYFSRLIQHEQVRAISISATSSGDEDHISHLYHSILPSTNFNARAVVLLIQRLEWSLIAVISNQNLNFMNAKRTFVEVAKEYGIRVALEMETSLRSSQQISQELLNFGIKIIVAFVPPSEAVDIVCSVHPVGFKWPDYAWIFMEIEDNEIAINSEFCPQNSVNNVIFLRPHLNTMHEDRLLPSGLNYSAYYSAYLEQLKESATELNVSLQSNPYANVLYDFIWAFALSVNGSLSTLKARNLSLTNISHAKSEIISVLEERLVELSFQGATGLLNFNNSAAARQILVELFQFQKGQSIQIGSYDSSLDQLHLNVSALGEIPSDTLNRTYVLYPVPLTVILSIIILLCLVLTNVSMCLFIYYRNQPVIKATSSTLSLCIFIGCQFLLTSSLFHTIASGNSAQDISDSHRAFFCLFDAYLFSIGLDIIFATVIAKTLRVYHIFRKFGKINKVCSDQGLFIFVLIIVLVKIAPMILWTCLDIYHLVDREQYISHSVPPYFIVTKLCQSKHLGLWLALEFGYSVVLLLVMVLL